MNELTHAPSRQPPTLPTYLADETRMLALESLAPSTRRAYETQVRQFKIWCQSIGVTPFPTDASVLAGYITHLTKLGRRVPTLEKAIAAISALNALAGINGLSQSVEVTRAMSGARRVLGIAPTRKQAATAPLLLQMMSTIQGQSLKALRDRSLLALGFAGAFRRSELVALTVEDIEETDEGALVTIRRSKTDQEGAGQTIGIPNGHYIRPLHHLNEWLTAAHIESGPVFHSMDRHGNIKGPLSAQSVAHIVKKAASAAGLDPVLFAGHSLRAGFITSGVEAGSDAICISEVSRHRSLDVLRGYVRRANLLKNHSGSAFL